MVERLSILMIININKMENYIDKIKQALNRDLNGEVKTFEDLISFFSMNEKALNEDVGQCDQYFNNQLPNDYKNFLANYNGGVLFQIKDFIGYELLGTQQIINTNTVQKSSFGENWDDKIILFCRILGDAEFLGFKIANSQNYEIIHCFMDEWPEKWKVIGVKLNDFISKLIDEKGLEFWYDND